jgi:hypothetical protein
VKPILPVSSQIFISFPQRTFEANTLDIPYVARKKHSAVPYTRLHKYNMLTQTLLALATAATTSAHFILNWPPTAGFVDDTEATGPCGGATVTVNSSSPEVQVGRFAAQIQSSHPTGNWQFRATLDTQEPYNWTNLSMVQTQGPGIFCLNYLSAPEDFAGNAGVLQVVDYSGDGTLYQVCPDRGFL